MDRIVDAEIVRIGSVYCAEITREGREPELISETVAHTEVLAHRALTRWLLAQAQR